MRCAQVEFNILARKHDALTYLGTPEEIEVLSVVNRNFGQLKLDFPILSFYEGLSTVYTKHFAGWGTKKSDIVGLPFTLRPVNIPLLTMSVMLGKSC